MGGFCGVISREDCVTDLFFGIDYHSHLGTHRGGMAVLEPEGKFLRAIHNIQNAPFRTKFEQDFARFRGHAGLGVISDTDPQPLVMESHLGVFALVTVGLVANMEALKNELFENRHAQLQYSTTSGALGQTELVSAIIASQDTIVDGLRRVQAVVEGSLSLLLVTADGTFYAMRDRYGRTPVVLERRDGAMIAVQESCALANLGYEHLRDLGPGEVVVMTPDGARTVVEPGDTMAICSFLWVYYGYPASSYEGRNVEMARYRCGGFLARRNPVEADNVGGVPDSGTSHALGYAHEAGLKYARPFVKYTPTWARSFMPGDQRQRDRVASMKLIPIPGLIRDKRLVFCDDSIVRGTQLRDNVGVLFEDGAKEVHMRIACPPLIYGCPFIGFTSSKSDMELITRRVIQELEGDAHKNLERYADASTPEYERMTELIRQRLGLTSLKFNKMETLVKAIGLPKCRLCTHCFDGTGCCGLKEEAKE